MVRREEVLKQEIAKWNEALEVSTSQAADKVKQLEETATKEKDRANQAEQAVTILQKSLEIAEANKKNAIEALRNLQNQLENAQATAKKDKDDAEARVEVLEAQVRMLKEQHVHEIQAAKEKAIDDAWYRMWSTNPEVLNLDFLGEARESILARWNLRLEQEELEATLVEGVDEDEEDCGEVVSAPGLKLPKSPSTLAAEIDALDKEIDEAAEASKSPGDALAVSTLGGVASLVVEIPDDQS